MGGCERIRVRELFKSMNVCRLQSVMKYDWITNLLQVCYWTPLEFNYLYSFTRVALYYNLHRPYKGGGLEMHTSTPWSFQEHRLRLTFL